MAFWRPQKIEYLKQQYLNPEVPITEIAEKLGVSAPTVNAKAKKLGIYETRKMIIEKTKTEQEKKMWQAYNAGLSDYEIAYKAGTYRTTVKRWRIKQGLCPNTRRKPRGGNARHVHMSKVLTPEQCIVMERFLQDLSRTARVSKEKGLGYVNISKFMKIWRNMVYPTIERRRSCG